jgi:hypothetical protein
MIHKGHRRWMRRVYRRIRTIAIRFLSSGRMETHFRFEYGLEPRFLWSFLEKCIGGYLYSPYHHVLTRERHRTLSLDYDMDQTLYRFREYRKWMNETIQRNSSKCPRRSTEPLKLAGGLGIGPAQTMSEFLLSYLSPSPLHGHHCLWKTNGGVCVAWNSCRMCRARLLIL